MRREWSLRKTEKFYVGSKENSGKFFVQRNFVVLWRLHFLRTFEYFFVKFFAILQACSPATVHVQSASCCAYRVAGGVGSAKRPTTRARSLRGQKNRIGWCRQFARCACPVPPRRHRELIRHATRGPARIVSSPPLPRSSLRGDTRPIAKLRKGTRVSIGPKGAAGGAASSSLAVPLVCGMGPSPVTPNTF